MMENNKSSFNWFPGHMNKTIKEIEKQISIVDLVIYIVDARAPMSTQNFIFKNILKNKRIIYLMSKSDIADKKVTSEWLDFFNKAEKKAMLIEKNSKQNKSKLIDFIYKNLGDLIQKQKNRGYEKANLNVIVIGIPNVGKSTFINSLSSQKKVNAANKPGVTRGLQRINLNDEITLIDTPGIAPSKFENQKQALICAASNCLKIFDDYKEDVAYFILKKLVEEYPQIVEKEFKTKVNKPEIIDTEFLYNLFLEINKSFNVSEDNITYSIDQVLNKVLNYKIIDISFERYKDYER